MKKTQTGLLHLAPDWTVMSDLNNKFVIPTWTVISQLRPDLFVFSITQKTCIKQKSGNFIPALSLVEVKTTVTIDCLSCHQSIDNKDSIAIFQLTVGNTVRST